MHKFKSIDKEIIVNRSMSDVWEIWTTKEGVLTFFAPAANLELKIGGSYEMLFDLKQPPGKQGSEGSKILSYLPNKMLSFDWNAPLEFGRLRDEKTVVVILFDDPGNQKTRVNLSHIGWGEDAKWNKLYEYFDRAWDIVLGRLKYSLETAPIDWSNPYSPS